MENKEKKYNYLIQNTALFAISSFGSKFLSFILVPLYTNVLTPSEYGIADILSISNMLLIYLFTFNISSAVLRFAIDKNENSTKVFKYGINVLLKGSIVLLICILVVWKLGLTAWDNYCFAFLFGLFLSESLQSILSQYLRAIDQIRVMAVAGIVSTAVRLFSNILLLVIFHFGLVGYLVSMLLGPAFAALYSLKHILPLEKVKTNSNDKRLHHEMLKYSLPLAVNQMGWWVNNSVDRYFVLGMKGAALNGIYAVAYKIPNIMSMLCNLFIQAWGISAIKEFDKNDKDGFFEKIYAFYNSGLVMSCSLLIIVNVPLSKLLFAGEFFEAWKYSSFLVLAMVFMGLSSFLSCIFTAVKQSKELAVTTFISAIVNISLNSVLLPKLGGQGAAIATAAAFYVTWLSRLMLSKKFMKFKINIWRDHLAYALIIIQIIFEHMERHCYVGQAIVVLILFILYFNQLKRFYHKLVSFVKRIRTKESRPGNRIG